jgi:myo-inositol-1-phosphate synthase
MSKRLGLWLIGAYGGVSSTVAVGLAALQQDADRTSGLVSELPEFKHLNLVGWNDIVVGGHEIRQTDYHTEAMILVGARAIDRETVESCKPVLAQFDANIKPGVLFNVGDTIHSLADKKFLESSSTGQPADTPRQCIDLIQKDLDEFAAANDCDQVIVVNLASTEPPIDESSLPAKWSELSANLDSTASELPASSLYAIAAIESGRPFVNFTPSLGSCPAAIRELAIEKGVCHMGHDGKTGETFLKSVMAPAFAHRNLEIMSWVGHNIFGNMDGQVLNDPINKQTKVTSKDKLLGQILGYDPQTHISIEYIKSLGDWKTAWDHIHFRGFLGTPMTLQFTWQGCDSILAAPLVLDLARFTELASGKGESGLLTCLSSFFKSPLGTDENDFAKQYQQLVDWANQ